MLVWQRISLGAVLLIAGCAVRTPFLTPEPILITVIVKETVPAPTQLVTVIVTPTLDPFAMRPVNTAVPAPPLPPAPPGGGRLPPPGNLIGSCSIERCLSSDPTFMELPTGLTTLRGYYAPVSREAFGQRKICDTLVVSDTTERNELIEAFKSLVRKGNTLNSIEVQGQLELTLALGALSASEQAQVRASTMNQPVTITVLRPIRPGQSAPVCASFIEVLRVN